MTTTPVLPERIASKIAEGPAPDSAPHLGPCWLWMASDDGYGYGACWFEKRMTKAHIVTYRLLVGEVPSGLQLDHLCRVRRCVRPSHLEPVTSRENTLRGDAGLHKKVVTHCTQGHEYALHAYEIPSRPGIRYCQACNIERSRCRRARKKEPRMEQLVDLLIERGMLK